MEFEKHRRSLPTTENCTPRLLPKAIFLFKMNKLNRKFRIWEGLLDSSIYFALAGMKAQGLSAKKAKACLKKRWQRAQAEHHRANLKIIRKLHGQRDQTEQEEKGTVLF